MRQTCLPDERQHGPPTCGVGRRAGVRGCVLTECRPRAPAQRAGLAAGLAAGLVAGLQLVSCLEARHYSILGLIV